MRENYHQATMAMTAEEFRKTIAAFGMSQTGASGFLGIERSKLNSYATGRLRRSAVELA
jgi:hypothetical protein